MTYKDRSESSGHCDHLKVREDAEAVACLTSPHCEEKLTSEAVAYLRGRLYENRKRQHGGDRRSEESSPHCEDLKTSDLLAEQLHVSRATIERDAAFTRALDGLTELLVEALSLETRRRRRD